VSHTVLHVVLFIFKTVAFIIGMYIALLSYRSYIKKADRSMLFLGAGFAVISLAVIIEGIIFEVLLWNLELAHTIQSILFTIGMILIYLSLREN